ncbi:MAG: patatin-like phospholipase family protein [Bacteroidales bacterium]
MVKKYLSLFFVLLLIFLSLNTFCQNKRPKVGLVLSGGGAKGLAHIGVLKAIEEAGIEIDYIGGTSMGGVIGGLYAIGYSPDSLVSIATDLDWTYLLSDRVPLENIPLEEKIYDKKYFFTFPVKEGLTLPKGLVTGQNIDLLLRRLTSPAYKQKDFSKFPIPFLTVATNIVDGNPVVIKKGDLAEALRATMSIPSFFIPVDYEGAYVVDGGVVDNYPVREVKKMGADIIIGVDVQSPLYTRDELNSLVKVISQTNSFYNQKSFVENKKLTNIYIQPNIKGYDMLSFEASDTLVQRGLEAGKLFLPKLKRLADSLDKIAPPTIAKHDVSPIDSIFVKAVIVKGLNRVPEQLVTNELHIRPNSWVKIQDIENNINRLYASGFFNLVQYRLIAAGGKDVIVEVNVTEAKSGIIGVGVHFDSYYDISILATLKFKNVGIKGSNLYINAGLGKYPILKTIYYTERGLKPGYGIELEAFGFDFYNYIKEKKEASYSFFDSKLNFINQFTLKKKYSLGLKAGLELTNTSNNLGDPKFNHSYLPYFNIELFHKTISFDNWYFPTKGIFIEANLKFTNFLGNRFQKERNIYPFTINSYTFTGKFMGAFSFNSRLTLIPEIYVGLSLLGTSPPLQYRFYLGGDKNNYLETVFPFFGLNLMQKTGSNAISGNLSLRYKLLKKNYVNLGFSSGGVGSSLLSIYEKGNLNYGYGISYAYDSYIGPIKLGISSNSKFTQSVFFISLGYSF